MKFKTVFLKNILYNILLFIILGIWLFLSNCQSLRLSAPENIFATDGIYQNKITVTWDSVKANPYNPFSADADYYRVYRSDYEWIDSNIFFQVSSEIKESTFDDTTAEIGEIYFYKVKAFSYNGYKSEFSNYNDGYMGSINDDLKVHNSEIKKVKQVKHYINILSTEHENWTQNAQR